MIPFMAIAAGFAIAGTATSLMGGLSGAKAAKKIAQYDMGIAQQEIEQNRLRERAMNLDNSRRKIENIRQMQMAQASALNTATNQGAGMSSGLFGGLAQVTNAGYWNALGLDQNREIGTAMFRSDDIVNNFKVLKAQQGGKMADAQGVQAIGGALTKIGGTFASLGGGFGGGGGGGSPPFLSGIGDDYS